MRVFIAVDLSDDQKNELAQLQSSLAGQLTHIKWVSINNIHITIKFLGEITTEELGKVVGILNSEVSILPGFYIRLGGLGVFPHVRRPRVLWAGLKQGQNELIRLSQVVEEALAGTGFKKSVNSFSPHVTLGRFRQPPPGNTLKDVIKNSPQFKSGNHLVSGINIYHSTLKPSGPQYKSLHLIKTAHAPN